MKYVFGTSFNRRHRHRIARATESDTAFESKKTETMDLRNLCLCRNMCRRTNGWSTQSQTDRKPTWFSRKRRLWIVNICFMSKWNLLLKYTEGLSLWTTGDKDCVQCRRSWHSPMSIQFDSGHCPRSFRRLFVGWFIRAFLVSLLVGSAVSNLWACNLAADV